MPFRHCLLWFYSLFIFVIPECISLWCLYLHTTTKRIVSVCWGVPFEVLELMVRMWLVISHGFFSASTHNSSGDRDGHAGAIFVDVDVFRFVVSVLLCSFVWWGAWNNSIKNPMTLRLFRFHCVFRFTPISFLGQASSLLLYLYLHNTAHCSIFFSLWIFSTFLFFPSLHLPLFSS